MKINPATTSNIQSTNTSAEAKKTDKTKASGYEAKVENGSSAKAESARADISSKAKDMAKAKQIAADTPDVREAKIADLKSRIQNKTYNVSADAIADKLVDDHMSMKGA